MTRLLNAFKPVQLAAAPASPQEGWLYYDTTQAKLGVYLSGAWQYLPGVGSGVPAGSALIQDSAGQLDVNASSAESSTTPGDLFTVDLTDTEVETIASQVETFLAEIAFPDEPNPAPTHSVGDLTVQQDETNAVPTHTVGDLDMTQADEPITLATHADIAAIAFPDNPNTTPTETKDSTLTVWLSGCTGTTNVTNPANADGVNNGTVSSQQSAIAGSATSTLTAASVGTTKLPTGTVFTAAICRPYFQTTSGLVTTTWNITATWTGGSAVVASAGQGTIQQNHLTGDLTFDLFAAGMNTVAKAQSMVITVTATDAAAGVTPVVMTVDAVAVEIPNIV